MKQIRGQNGAKKNAEVVNIDRGSLVSRINNKLLMVEQFKQPNYPVPSLLDFEDHHSSNWNPESLIDICDISFLTFEIIYTGANGLR
jgi:hypothetical protein